MHPKGVEYAFYLKILYRQTAVGNAHNVFNIRREGGVVIAN